MCPAARLGRDPEHDPGDRRLSRPPTVVKSSSVTTENRGWRAGIARVCWALCPSVVAETLSVRGWVSATKSAIPGGSGNEIGGFGNIWRVSARGPERGRGDWVSHRGDRRLIDALAAMDDDGCRRGPIGSVSTSATSRRGVGAAYPPTGRGQPRAIGAPLASSARTRPRPATPDPQRAATHAARGSGTPRRPRLVDLRRGARRSAPLRPRRPARTVPALRPRALDRRPARLAPVRP